MSEKIPSSVEDSAFEDRDALSYRGSKTVEVVQDDKQQAPHQPAAKNLDEAPDGGLRAWLMVVASVHD